MLSVYSYKGASVRRSVENILRLQGSTTGTSKSGIRDGCNNPLSNYGKCSTNALRETELSCLRRLGAIARKWHLRNIATSLEEKVLGRKETCKGGPRVSKPGRDAVPPFRSEARQPARRRVPAPRRGLRREGKGSRSGRRESRRLTVLAELAGHPGRAAAGARGGVAGAAVLAAAGQAAVLPEGADRAGWGEKERESSAGCRSEGEESFFARCPPASLTLVTEDAGPARRTLAARLLRVARGSVLAVLAGQAAVGAERVLQADCNEKRCG